VKFQEKWKRFSVRNCAKNSDLEWSTDPREAVIRKGQLVSRPGGSKTAGKELNGLLTAMSSALPL